MANIYGLLLVIVGTFFAFMFRRAADRATNPIARATLWQMVWAASAMALLGLLVLLARASISYAIRACKSKKREKNTRDLNRY